MAQKTTSQFPWWLSLLMASKSKNLHRTRLPSPGLPVDAAESDLLQTAVRLTRDLAERLPEIEAQNETLRDVLDKLERDWRQRPSTVLGADDPRDLLTSTHVVAEVDSAADQDTEVSLRSAKRAFLVAETDAAGPDGGNLAVPVVNLCLNGPGERVVAESNNYLIWVLRLADSATTNRLVLEHKPRTCTPPNESQLVAGSATEFRSMLGTSGRSDVVDSGRWTLFWGSKNTLVLKLGNTPSELASPGLYTDPVKLLAVADLYMRNYTSQSEAIDKFLAKVLPFLASPDGQVVYHSYACLWNSMANESNLTAALAKRNRPRNSARQHTASDWYRRVSDAARLQQNTLVVSRCVGYLPSAVNVVATPDKLLVPEDKFQVRAAHRVVLFLRCSALDPYFDSVCLVVLETTTTTPVLHVLGHLPVWFGSAHTDALSAWLQVHCSAQLWNLAPFEFLVVVESLTGQSAGTVEEAVSAARGRQVQVAAARKEAREVREVKEVKEGGADAAWATVPLMGRLIARLTTGQIAAENVPPVFQKSGALAKFQRDVASVFAF
jgi:hypothetical protein